MSAVQRTCCLGDGWKEIVRRACIEKLKTQASATVVELARCREKGIEVITVLDMQEEGLGILMEGGSLLVCANMGC